MSAYSAANDTLATTQLVHDLYLKLKLARGSDGDGAIAFPDRARFFAYAAKTMRTLMIDYARSRKASRIRDAASVDLPGDDRSDLDAHLAAGRALDFERALSRLRAEDPRASELVDLHLFLDLPLADIAALLGIAPRTADRDWRFARAFLADALER